MLTQQRMGVGLAIAAGVAAATGWYWRGAAGRRESGLGDEPRQWPMDRAELASGMDRVLADQRQRLAETAPGPARERVSDFLRYYEQRRARV